MSPASPPSGSAAPGCACCPLAARFGRNGFCRTVLLRCCAVIRPATGGENDAAGKQEDPESGSEQPNGNGNGHGKLFEVLVYGITFRRRGLKRPDRQDTPWRVQHSSRRLQDARDARLPPTRMAGAKQPNSRVDVPRAKRRHAVFPTEAPKQPVCHEAVFPALEVAQSHELVQRIMNKRAPQERTCMEYRSAWTIPRITRCHLKRAVCTQIYKGSSNRGRRPNSSPRPVRSNQLVAIRPQPAVADVCLGAGTVGS